MRRLLAPIAAALLLAVSCTTEPPPEPAGEFGAGPRLITEEYLQRRLHSHVTQTLDGGPQLITEEYLRRGLDLHVTQTLDVVIVEALGGRGWEVVASGLSEHWDRDATGWVTYRPPHYSGPAFRAEIIFAGPAYAADGGSVVEDNCRELPGAGVATTGEFSDIDNETDIEIEHDISKAVTESESHSTSLTQSLELSSGQTIEAGASFGPVDAKATISFEQKFGLETGSVAEYSKQTEDTVADTIPVPGQHEFDIAFTTDNSAVSCDLRIEATGDWTSLSIRPPRDRPYTGNTWCGSGADDPNHLSPAFRGRGSNGNLLLHSDAVDKRTCTIHLDSADAVVRLVTGFDVRCPHCGDMAFSALAERALDWFGRPQSRHISFDGKRRSAARKDASYKVLDVTGFDRDCVRDILDDVGTPVTDDLLDSCVPIGGSDDTG